MRTIMMILCCALSVTSIKGAVTLCIPDKDHIVIIGKSAISNMSIFIDADIVRDNTNMVYMNLILSDPINTMASICSESVTSDHMSNHRSSHIESIPVVSAYAIHKIKINKHNSGREMLYLTQLKCVKTIRGNITNQVIDCVFGSNISFDDKNEYYFILEKYDRIFNRWKKMDVMDEVPEGLGDYFIDDVIPTNNYDRILELFKTLGLTNGIQGSIGVKGVQGD